jgi:iron complex transport system substrate-binding protein
MCIVLGAEEKLIAIDGGTKSGMSHNTFNIKLRPKLQSLPAPMSMNSSELGNRKNIEQLIALEPEVVLVGGYKKIRMIEELREAGLTVVTVHFEEIENYSRDLKIIGEVTGRQREADKLASYLEPLLNSISTIVSEVPCGGKVRACFASRDVYHVYGSSSFEHSQIIKAGGINVAENVKSWQSEITSKQLIEWDPEVIFALNMLNVSTLLSDTKIQKVSAIVNRRISPIPEGGWDFGSLRAIFAIQWMAAKLYPERFSSLDLDIAANEFYRKCYKISYDGPPLN